MASNKASEYAKILRSTIWLTGRPCSGKTTIARQLKKQLQNQGCRVVHLDGDDVRSKLNADLGFSEQDKKENLRRVAHVARLFNENENVVIASFIAPTDMFRQMIKGIVGSLKLVYVKCRLETCEKRDSKGMYAKARKGEIKDFIGISALFEEPANPDITVETDKCDVKTCVNEILNALKAER